MAAARSCAAAVARGVLLLRRSPSTLAATSSAPCGWLTQCSSSTTTTTTTPLRPGWCAAWRVGHPLHHQAFSSRAGSADATTSSEAAAAAADSSASSSSEAVVDQLEQVMGVMLQNPALSEMMLARMPPHMRRPEVLRAMLASPEVRARIGALAKQTGMASLIQAVDAGKMQAGMSASLAAGIDPTAVTRAFQASPSLAKSMENPRVMAALMDMASNGADALKKYQGDKDIVEAAMEAGEILQQLQQQQGGAAASSSSNSSSSSTSSSISSSGGDTSLAAMQQQLGGADPQELMQRLMARPDLVAKISNPKVQAALMEVSQSPWKVVKHLFDSEVMGALKEMKDLLPPRGK